MATGVPRSSREHPANPPGGSGDSLLIRLGQGFEQENGQSNVPTASKATENRRKLERPSSDSRPFHPVRPRYGPSPYPTPMIPAEEDSPTNDSAREAPHRLDEERLQ